MIKLNATTYYTNKPRLTSLLKKLKLKWDNNRSGWFGSTEEHIEKLPEEGNLKCFNVVGCKEVLDLLISFAVSDNKSSSKFDNLETPWQPGKCWEYRKQKMMENWDPNFKVVWK